MATTQNQFDIIAKSKAQAVVKASKSETTVSIEDINNSANNVLLETDEASYFITKAESMVEKNGDVSFEDSCYFFAQDYLILL